MSSICECCTATEDLSVFHESYVEVFMSCFSIKINNSVDRKICLKCIKQLGDSYCFRLLVLKTQFALKESPVKREQEDDLNNTKDNSFSDDSFSEDDNKTLCYIKKKFFVKNDTCNTKRDEKPLNSTESWKKILNKSEGNSADKDIKKKVIKTRQVRNRGSYVYKAKQSVSKMLPNFIDMSSEIPQKSVTPMPNLSKEDLKCPVCNEIFPTNRLLVCHMNEHYCNFICETCGKGFMSKQGLQIHMKAHTGTCKCEICGKELSSKISLASHVHRHHRAEKNIYKCQVCDERFMYFYAKMKHMETEHGVDERKFQCKICGLRFLTGSYMNKHAKKHNLARERRFSCEKCGAAYFDKTTLMNHVNSHTGERPFQCTICPKAYPRKFSLREHMRVHDNDKRFSCHVCGRAFTQKCTLKGHLRTHEKEVQQKTGVDELSYQLDVKLV